MALIQWSIVIGVSLVAAVFDALTNRIPDVITIPLLLAGLIRSAWTNGSPGFVDAIAACVLLALPYVLMFFFAHGGAGDAKLMGAVGAWLGLFQGLIVFCCVAIAGIILAVATALIRRRLKVILGNLVLSVYSFMRLILINLIV